MPYNIIASLSRPRLVWFLVCEGSSVSALVGSFAGSFVISLFVFRFELMIPSMAHVRSTKKCCKHDKKKNYSVFSLINYAGIESIWTRIELDCQQVQHISVSLVLPSKWNSSNLSLSGLTIWLSLSSWQPWKGCVCVLPLTHATHRHHHHADERILHPIWSHVAQILTTAKAHLVFLYTQRFKYVYIFTHHSSSVLCSSLLTSSVAELL